MGSYNVSCSLTGLPISAGQPVRVLHVLHDVPHRSELHAPRDFFYGLPLKAKYADYGEADYFENKDLLTLHQKALATCGHFKEAPHSGVWVASNSKPLWAAPHQIVEYFADATSWNALQKRSQEFTPLFLAAKSFIDSLDQELALFDPLSYPKDNRLESALFQLIAKHAPHSCIAIPLFRALTRLGLIAKPDTLLMHEVAYDSLLESIGKLPASDISYSSKHKTVRSHISALLAQFLEQHPLAWEKHLALWGTDPEDYQGPSACRSLRPLTTLWTTTEAPVIGQFFGALPLEDILAHVSFDELVDFYVFCVGAARLRTGLKVGFKGSQDDLFKPQALMIAKTAQMLRSSR